MLVWLLVAGAGYALWLDRRVAESFEQRQWSLPARVYARPLEIYPDARLDRAHLMQELRILGYQRVGQKPSKGQYAASANAVEMRTRGFSFWDLPEPARQVRIHFEDGKVDSLLNVATGDAIGLMRLEPAEIGRINPQRFEDRQLLKYAELPELFVKALIEVEDRRFFSHHGVDFAGLARAMVANLKAMRLVQGGSTLTQQLVKNFYLTRERSFSRKMTELLMSLSLEFRYQKSRIFETYVNEVFLGQDGNRAVHGFGLASRFYFGKPLNELDIGQFATLIGLVKGPSAYDPRRKPDAAKRRRDVVLQVMRERGLINAIEFERLRASPLRLKPSSDRTMEANPALMGLVRRQLLKEYSADDLKSAGLNIFTSLDIGLQSRVETAVRDAMLAIDETVEQQQLQAAAVIVEPHNGEILALVGDRRPRFAGFNRALDAKRPVGSTIKPFVYALALSEPSRYSLASMVKDEAISWRDDAGNVWEPKNFDGREYGPQSLLDALSKSLNLATVQLGLQLGRGPVTDYLHNLGLPIASITYPSAVLGAIDLSVVELAELYTALANDGFQVPLRAILSVTDQQQKQLTRYGLDVRPVMTPATAALVRHALIGVVRDGTARRLSRDFQERMPLAGKTGTSDQSRDSWFAGFGANRLAVTWIGRDDNLPTGLTGSSGALRLWAAIMQDSAVLPLSGEMPEAIYEASVDLRRGQIVPAHCNNATRIPVHIDSLLPESEVCYGEADDEHVPGSRDPGLLERVRRWFE